MGQPAARLTDMHVCPMITPGLPPIPHVGGPITGPGCPTVLIGGMPASVMGDMCVCVGPPDTIILGSTGVLIGGMPAARMGDSCAHGGTIMLGCMTVLIGESGGGGGGGFSNMPVQVLLNAINSSSSTPPAVVSKMEQVVALKAAAQEGAPTASTVASRAEQKKQEAAKETKCKLASIKISEEHRGYKLIVQPKSKKKTLEVVAGFSKKPKTLQIDVQGLVGPCPDCNLNVIDLDGKPVNTSNNHTEMKVLSSDESSWKFWNIAPKRYALSAATCDGNVSAKIKVYPDIEANFGIKYQTVTLKEDKTFSKSSMGERYTEYKDDVSLEGNGISVSGSYKRDGVELKLETVFKEVFHLLTEVSNINNQLLGRIRQLADPSKIDISPVSWSLTGPTASLNFKGSYEEEQADYSTEFKLEIKVGFEPLVMLSMNMDLVGEGLLAIPAIGPFVAWIRKRLSENVDIQLNFRVEGGINITGSGTYGLKEKKWEGKFSPVGTLDFILEGIIKAHLHIWFIKLDAKVKGAGKMSFKAGANFKSESIELFCQFAGLVVVGQVLIGAGDNDTESGPPDGGESGGGREPEATGEASYTILDALPEYVFKEWKLK